LGFSLSQSFRKSSSPVPLSSWDSKKVRAMSGYIDITITIYIGYGIILSST